MLAAKPDEQSSVRDSISTLTPAQDIEMRRMDPNGDGFIAPKEARAEARVAAELRSSLSFWKKIALAILAFLFLSWIGNACLMAAIVFLSKDLKVEGGAIKNMDGMSLTTHNQRNVFEVTLTIGGGGGTPGNSTGDPPSPVVAQVACANVLLAIASIENGDDESLVKIAVGNAGDIWEPRMSAASYHLRESSFGIDQIYLGEDKKVSYDVTCEISKADCESTPDSLCDAKTFLDDLSFEDAFDGDQKVSRRRLTTAKLTIAKILGEVHQDSTSGDSLNTVGDVCALVPNSTKGSVAKLCKDMSDVGLDENIYCGQEVLKETEEAPLGSAPLEPSFTMREILTSADTEQTYNAVVDRCQPTTARRQMAWNPLQNYGWCSTALGFVAATVSSGVIGNTDSANYCDASTSEASQGKGSQMSGCCVEHDKCLACDPGDRGCTGSSETGETCDLELSTCAWEVSCSTQNTHSVWSWSWWSGWYQVTRTIWGYDFTCAAVSTLIAGVMGNSVMLPNGDFTC